MKNKNGKLFKIIFLGFLALVLFFLYDMSRQTTAPWNKKKQLERALPKD
jgi:uncharacterized membrane protein